jgi:hypothetical protein
MIRQNTRLLPLSLSVLLSGCFATSITAADTRELTQEMPIQGYTRLDIETGPGDLFVTGTDADTVQARLTLDFPDGWTDAQVQEVLDNDLKFAFTSSGERLRLDANLDFSEGRGPGADRSFFDRGDNDEWFIREVRVQVPAGLQLLRIDDGSGDADISGVAANLDVTDGSGDLHITNLTGNLTLDDGSGDVEIIGVTGDAELEDGSGDLDLRTVGGSVEIKDGSGDLDVADVQGDLRVRDGSGDVNTRTIAGTIDIRD